MRGRVGGAEAVLSGIANPDQGQYILRAEAVPIGATYLFGPFKTDDYGSQLAIDVDHAELTLQALRV